MTEHGGGPYGPSDEEHESPQRNSGSWFTPTDDRYRTQSQYEDPYDEEQQRDDRDDLIHSGYPGQGARSSAAGSQFHPGGTGGYPSATGGYPGLGYGGGSPGMVEPYPSALGDLGSQPGTGLGGGAAPEAGAADDRRTGSGSTSTEPLPLGREAADGAPFGGDPLGGPGGDRTPGGSAHGPALAGETPGGFAGGSPDHAPDPVPPFASGYSPAADGAPAGDPYGGDRAPLDGPHPPQPFGEPAGPGSSPWSRPGTGVPDRLQGPEAPSGAGHPPLGESHGGDRAPEAAPSPGRSPSEPGVPYSAPSGASFSTPARQEPTGPSDDERESVYRVPAGGHPVGPPAAGADPVRGVQADSGGYPGWGTSARGAGADPLGTADAPAGDPAAAPARSAGDPLGDYARPYTPKAEEFGSPRGAGDPLDGGPAPSDDRSAPAGGSGLGTDLGAGQETGSGNTWAFSRDDPRLPESVRELVESRSEPVDAEAKRGRSRDGSPEHTTQVVRPEDLRSWSGGADPAGPATEPAADDPLTAIAAEQARAREPEQGAGEEWRHRPHLSPHLPDPGEGTGEMPVIGGGPDASEGPFGRGDYDELGYGARPDRGYDELGPDDRGRDGLGYGARPGPDRDGLGYGARPDRGYDELGSDDRGRDEPDHVARSDRDYGGPGPDDLGRDGLGYGARSDRGYDELGSDDRGRDEPGHVARSDRDYGGPGPDDLGRDGLGYGARSDRGYDELGSDDRGHNGSGHDDRHGRAAGWDGDELGRRRDRGGEPAYDELGYTGAPAPSDEPGRDGPGYGGRVGDPGQEEWRSPSAFSGEGTQVMSAIGGDPGAAGEAPGRDRHDEPGPDDRGYGGPGRDARSDRGYDELGGYDDRSAHGHDELGYDDRPNRVVEPGYGERFDGDLGGGYGSEYSEYTGERPVPEGDYGFDGHRDRVAEDGFDDHDEHDGYDDYGDDYGYGDSPARQESRGRRGRSGRDRVAEEFPGFGDRPLGGSPGDEYPGYDNIDHWPDTDGLATTTLWLGIASLIPVIGLFTAVTALVLGPKARRSIQRSRGELDGLHLVKGGTIAAWIGIALFVVEIAVFAGLSLAG
ncbi:hypothetical protein HDA32_004976 [Spinactinospora alkalitolerans]|uniref:DUF4190 domain-containing protein n=1 Tax=Spinactinospora alkalitolerans TaxID=687207 RepID=A0A852TZ58_9ACTN|nr:hypothetical protein [Spinactinospora alkalitolerans]NYE49856.1 hypothetical protein [Spinactinospora alkalitolerans]